MKEKSRKWKIESEKKERNLRRKLICIKKNLILKFAQN